MRTLWRVGLLLVVLTQYACGEDKPPFERTTSFKTCADLFAKLAGDISKNAKLDALKISPSSIPDDGVYLASNGAVALRKAGRSDKSDVEVFEAKAAAEALAKFINARAEEGRRVIITGSIPLDQMYQRVRALNLGKNAGYVYFSVAPESGLAKAKQRLLDKSFSKVQIVMDLNVDSTDVQRAIGTFVNGEAMPRISLTNVEFISVKDIPGKGTLAERLSSYRPSSDTLRVSVVHQSAGQAIFSDGSRLSVSEFNQKRIEAGDMELIAACNLRPMGPNDWLLIDGEVLANEFHGLAADISKRFNDKKSLTGAEILEEMSRFDSPPPPPNDGESKPGDAGDNGNPKGSSKNTKGVVRRSLKILGLGGLIAFTALQDQANADDDDDDEKKKKRKGGALNGELSLGDGSIRISTRGNWVTSSERALEIAKVVSPLVPDRPVLFLDEKEERVHFFEPSRGTAYSVNAPAQSIKLTDKHLDDGQQQFLKDQASRFWFYTAQTRDPVADRTRLLKWQSQTGATLPFVFMVEKGSPTSATWTLLKPFFAECTHVGHCLPQSQAEANRSGLFWCTAHETAAKMIRYQQLAQIVGSAPNTKGVELRQNSADETAKTLQRLLTTDDSCVWLFGVWQDRGMRRPDSLIENNKWVDTHNCHGRMVFVSAFPVSKPVDGRYFETVANQALPETLKAICEAARADKAFFEVKDELVRFHQTVTKQGGIIAVSSCGKYLLISE